MSSSPLGCNLVTSPKIHQQAQVSSFKTFYSNLESLTIVQLSKYTVISMVFTKLFLENALAFRPCNYEGGGGGGGEDRGKQRALQR